MSNLHQSREHKGEGKALPQNKARNHTSCLSGGEALASMLALYETRYMFGMGGFQLLPFYDVVDRQGNQTPRHILVNDERSGAFAADGYARVSGRPGLCDGMMGPGATPLRLTAMSDQQQSLT